MTTTYNLGRVTNGFIILGFYADVAALQTAIPSPSVGDAYGVGASHPYNIHVWNGSAWIDNGTFNPAHTHSETEVDIAAATDYGVTRVRGIYFTNTDLEEGVSALPSGVIALVYQ